MKTPDFVILPLLALALAGCGPSIEEQFDRARSAYAEHRFDAARLDLASVIGERPTDVQALELLVRTQLQLGDGESALATLDRLKAAGSVPADAAELRGEAQLLRGEFDAALAAVESAPSAEGARIAALAQIGLGKKDAAAASFARGAQLAGSKVRLLSDHALFLMRSGKPDEAQAVADRALAEDSQALDPLIANARLAQARRDSGAALEFYSKANALWPESRAALLGRIGVLGDLGRLAEAGPLIEELNRRDPQNPDSIYLKARLVAEKGDWQQVRSLMQPIEDTTAIPHRVLYARALVEMGLWEQARGRLSPLLREVPQSVAVRRLMARAELGGGDPKQAMRILAPLASNAAASPADLALYAEAARASGTPLNGSSATGEVPPAQRLARHLAEGDTALREGKWRTAIDAYEQIREWTGDSNALVLNNLAYARAQVGEKDVALDLARKALKLAPDNVAIMDTAGWLMVDTGSDHAQGLRLLTEAAKRDPGNAAIAAHLAQARS